MAIRAKKFCNFVFFVWTEVLYMRHFSTEFSLLYSCRLDCDLCANSWPGISPCRWYRDAFLFDAILSLNRFSFQAIDHIINSAAKTLYMSAGLVRCRSLMPVKRLSGEITFSSRRSKCRLCFVDPMGRLPVSQPNILRISDRGTPSVPAWKCAPRIARKTHVVSWSRLFGMMLPVRLHVMVVGAVHAL